MGADDIVFRSPASVLQASSVALVGASERGKWPRLIFDNLRSFGYAGRVFLVNPRQAQVYGERCFPSLRELPEPVDHAIMIVPAAGVAAVLADAQAAGLKSATVYAGAVGDGEDPESKQRGAWLKSFLAQAELRLAGPNCMGAHSYRERLFAYPNSELCRVPPGSVGCVFQSGGTLQFWLRTGADRGLRFSYGITSGNEADLDLADYLNFLVEDPHTGIIALFIEGIRRPAAFMDAAARALAAGKPILAIKTGATAKSQAAAASHTGVIGGDYAAYLAMCERYGICNCRSLDDMVETALAFQGERLPKGPRIGFVTTSGGTVDLLFDYAESEGAVIPEFTAATNTALLPFLQDSIVPKNPLDLGIPSTLAARRQGVRGGGARSECRHGGLGRHAAEQERRLGRGRGAARSPEPDRQAGHRLWPHELSDATRIGRRPGGGRLSVPAGAGADAAGHERLVVLRAADRPLAGDAAAGAGEQSFAREPRREPRALRHCAAGEPRGGDGGRGRGGRAGDRVSGRAQDPLARHPAQDRSRRRHARSAQRRGGRRGRRRAHGGRARHTSGCAHRRLAGAGDGVRRRGDRRRAQRSALRTACC